MKKKLAAIGFATIITVSAVTAYASNEMTVGYQVDPAYTVTIPTDMQVTYNEVEGEYGKIIVEEAKLAEDKCIEVTAVSDRTLKNQSDSSSKIPYQIKADGEIFTSARYTKVGEETSLTISIKEEDWQKAVAGEYKDNVIFEINYVDKE